MNKLFKILLNRFFYISIVFLLFIIIATGNDSEKIVTYNINKPKSIEAMHIVNKYNSLLDEIEVVFADTFDQVVKEGSSNPVMFIGTLTGYGPDCVGCGGRVGCPPRQDVRNGNIYFNDNEYGKVRIVATDAGIPCGSMVRISNYSFISTPFLAIALDRGGAINGKTMDLLYNSESETVVVGRQYNIQFEIIRWGW